MGLRYHVGEHVGKGYDGVNFSKSNLEVETFVAWWVVQMEEDMHGLGAVEEHMPLWGVVGKEMCYCRFVLMLQEGRTLINHKPNNYDWNDKGPIP